MALSRLLASSLFLSLLAVDSAFSFYVNGNQQRPRIPVDELRDYMKRLIGHANPTQPESSDVHKEEYQCRSEQDVKPKMPDNFIPAKRSYGRRARSENYYYEARDGVNYVEIRGTILRKSGISSYTAIPGAIAKITCPSWNENRYEYGPFSISSVADEHGFYRATFPVSKLPNRGWTQLVKECRVFAESSPVEMCNQPTIVGGGSDGEYVSYSHNAGDTAYYNAGSLLCTGAESSYNGGY